MVERDRGNHEIGLRKGTALRDQESPFAYEVLADGEHALFEHRPHLVREPIVQFSAARGIIGNTLDTEADFRKGDRTDVEQVERLRRDKGEDLRFWPGSTQF
jgi:hypothetical protein